MPVVRTGLVHPAISAVASDALGRLGASVETVPSGPVTVDAQRSSLVQILELGGRAELFIAGREFKRFHEFPLFLVLLNSDSVRVLLEKITRLNRYFHSDHRHEVREERDFRVELEHVALRGQEPDPAESLFVSGLYLAVMEEVGCVGMRCAFPLSASSEWVYSAGTVSDVPSEGTSRWLFEWDDFEARRPLPGLDELLLRDPGQDLEVNSLTDHVGYLVERDLSRQWRVQSIAADLLMSPRTLQRRLREEGTTLTTILIERRLARARRLLVDTTKSITDIGYMLGFSDTPHFTRTFVAATGSPPSQWRRSHLTAD